GIVDDRVPHRPAAALRPPLAAPGLRGHRHRWVLEALGWIAGRGPEAPDELARIHIVGGYVTAHAELDPAVADDDLAIEDAGCARDGVRPVFVIDRQRRPQGRPGARIEGDEPAIER